ncbi:hypothetical protein V1514DRAFT_116770 [Lipomyces japonicus]|uniref:uncharacterized protein n=1 Tax=Lipomyces japonicus TaxID=56871 RepID=UPI0034CE7006
MKISFFQAGLRVELQELLLARGLPDTFDEFSTLCTNLDSSWRMMHLPHHNTVRISSGQGRRGNRWGYYNGNPWQQTNNSWQQPNTPRPLRPMRPTAPVDNLGYAPMDLSAARVQGVRPKEIARRLNENLCIRCGQPGHYKLQCPELRRTPPQHQRQQLDTDKTTFTSAAQVMYSVDSGNEEAQH